MLKYFTSLQFKVDKFSINKAYHEYSDKYGVLPGLNLDYLNQVK